MDEGSDGIHRWRDGWMYTWMDEGMDRIRRWRENGWMNRCMTVRLDKYVFTIVLYIYGTVMVC